MTNKRANLMNKLRDKFGWSSRRYPPDNTELVKSIEDSDRDVSMFVTIGSEPLYEEIINPGKSRAIQIKLIELDKTEPSRYPKTIEACLTFEELDIIYNIVKEKQYEAIVRHIVPEKETDG